MKDSGYFGDYGGQYVPESLVPLLDELSHAIKTILPRSDFRHALATMTTAEELYNAVPRARPVDRGTFLSPHPTEDGVYKYSHQLFSTLPDFDWNILMRLGLDGEPRPGAAPMPSTPGGWSEAADLALPPIHEV